MPHHQSTCRPTVLGHEKTDAHVEPRTGGRAEDATMGLGNGWAVLLALYSGVFLCVGSIGCAPRSGARPLLDRLEGRGPVVLSQSNPFLPADRVFDNAVANSSVIKEFVEQQGKPAALSVDDGLLSATTLTFYYPGKEEFYTLQPAGDDWEVSGPDSMFPDEAQAMLSELGGAVPASSNSYITEKRTTTLGRSSGSLSNLDTISARARMEPQKVTLHGTEKVQTKSKLQGKGRRGPSTPQKATVKKLASGSLQHTVTFTGETLGSISKWYTGSSKNTPVIAKLNKMSPEHRLTIGERVIIPKQMLKTQMPMPRAAVL